MPSQPLTYTSKDDPKNATTMLVYVNEEAYQQYLKSTDTDMEPDLNGILDSFDIFKYSQGSQGQVSKPSKSELEGVFGTNDNTKILQFMVQHGRLHGTTKAKKEVPAMSRPEELLMADRRAY